MRDQPEGDTALLSVPILKLPLYFKKTERNNHFHFSAKVDTINDRYNGRIIFCFQYEDTYQGVSRKTGRFSLSDMRINIKEYV
jgi:hypothetical protein